jgi:hypothetical protein
MMTNDRLERQLPGLLTELADPQTPDYFDDLLWQTAHTSQRPAWTIIQRWLPMVDIARQPVIAPGIPFRTIGLALLLVGLFLAALAAFIVGSRPNVPPPFGPARNGHVAYAKDGDIYTLDPFTGDAKAIVTGPGMDAAPVHSLDGTHIVFQRGVLGGLAQLYVARSDGRGVTLLTPTALADLANDSFSPDGSELIFDSTVDGASAISIAKSDGSGMRTLALGVDYAWSPAYRPPSGDEIAFVGSRDGEPPGLYIAHADGSGVRRLVVHPNLDVYDVGWSPDGSRITYTTTPSDPAVTGMSGAQVHVFSVIDSTDRVTTPPPRVAWQGQPRWSNDGSRLLIWRCHSNPSDPTQCVQSSAVIPADGSGFGVDLDGGRSVGVEGASQGWAPDDRSILTTALDPLRQPKEASLLWDPATGVSRAAPWAAPGDPSWQRLAP